MICLSSLSPFTGTDGIVHTGYRQDLAGSERIGKTGAVGNLATEAKYINLSLHFLEQVSPIC